MRSSPRPTDDICAAAGPEDISPAGAATRVTSIPNSQRLFRLLAWCALGAILIATLVPIALRPISGLPVNVERFLAFALIGALFAAGYPQRFWLVSVLVLLAAGGFEIAQHLTLTRHGNVMDFIVKGLGAGFGLAATRAVILYRAERRRRLK